MNAVPACPDRYRQQGIVLPVVLVMLLMLIIASLVITEQIKTQTRIASNAAVNQIAMQAAEAALRNTTNQLLAGTILTDPGAYQSAPTPYTATGQYLFDATQYIGTMLPWQNPKAWAALPSTLEVCSNTTVKECKFMVEKLPSVRPPGYSTDVSVFRITARVVGPDGQSVVMLQTQLQKR
ncbi:pilus assembly PilX family protein [Dyella japonica]|uniref:Tfp pilus assembly protein PilX n=1 Tax=Dyella japonica TaxID=231455 RepID=A0ABV2K157_9GAMM